MGRAWAATARWAFGRDRTRWRRELDSWQRCQQIAGQKHSDGGRLLWDATKEMDDTLKQRIVSQTAASFGKIPMAQMERERDDKQIALLRALAAQRSKPAGQ